MKKLTCILLLLIASCQLFSQAMPSVTDTAIKTDYLKKSKNQKMAGTICTATGAALMGIGLIIVIGNAAEDLAIGFTNLVGAFGFAEPIPAKKHSNAGAIITVTGTAVLVTGITYLVIAKNSKKKAFALTIKNEQTHRLQANILVNTMMPSIGLKWQFGNR